MFSDFFNIEKFKFIDNFFNYITYDEFLKSNYILVDLRTKLEHDFKSIDNSIHLPLMDDNKSIELEGMFENKTYFSTSIKSIIFIVPNLCRIKKEINKLEKNNTIVLACRHARIRSRTIAMFVNILGSNVLVLKDGINPILKVDKKQILNLNK